jgi:alpha-aminoadipic semialdehyde synthase
VKKNLVVGILPESKNIWERRAPLSPEDVAWLTRRKIPVEVSSSSLRIYKDSHYRQARAQIVKKFRKANLLIGIKEPRIDTLIPHTIYMVFSHTTKGQKYNRKLLSAILKKKITLIDYEHITDSCGRRLVYFGRFAGICGMIDTLHVFGKRTELQGIPNPFSALKSAICYKNFSSAKTALRRVSTKIQNQGLDERLAPFVIGILGRGNVSRGAHEVLEHIGAIDLHPENIGRFSRTRSSYRNSIYKLVFQREQKFRSKKGKEFCSEEYFNFPEQFESNLDKFLPFLTILINASYWECRYPRLLPEKMLRKLYRRRPDFRLSVIGDLGCDIEGTIEVTRKATTPSEPAIIYDPVTGKMNADLSSRGIAVMATDNLPCELPLESSKEFSRQIRDYVYHIAVHGVIDVMNNHEVPSEIRNAVVTQNGMLTHRFRHMNNYI